MILREALKRKGWEVFENEQKERWNTTDLLNQVLLGESPEWLDAEVQAVGDDYIIDNCGDELREVKE